MSLEQLSKTVDFVQDATPSASDVNDGETYLDTSQSPPQLKVFDSGANAFVKPRSIQNLDAPVSGAGATTSDIEAGAEDALEEDIANLSPASNSVAGQLDGGVSGGVDWSSKTPKFDGGLEFSGGTGVDLVAVSGSGFLLSVSASGDTQDNHLRIDIDGTTVRDQDMADQSGAIDTGAANDHKAGLTTSPIYRFDSSFAVGTGSSMSGSQLSVGVYYVLD